VVLPPVLDARPRVRLDSASAEGAYAWGPLSLVLVALEPGGYLPVFIIPILLVVIVLLIAIPGGISSSQTRYIFLFLSESVWANRGDVDSQFAQDVPKRMLLALRLGDGSPEELTALPAGSRPVFQIAHLLLRQKSLGHAKREVEDEQGVRPKAMVQI
jgi:hypothetical protein